jgi:hypothetical protein
MGTDETSFEYPTRRDKVLENVCYKKGDVFSVVYERRLAAGTGGIDAVSEIGDVVIKEIYGITAKATVRRGGMEILRLMKEDATLFVRSKN